MPGNDFYKGAFWRALRAKAMDRAGGRCEVSGCRQRGLVVDHIQARPRGEEGVTAWDTLGNLRVLCRSHDNQVKEMADGRRKRGGALYLAGSDAAGFPLDPRHPWFQGGGAEGSLGDGGGDELLDG